MNFSTGLDAAMAVDNTKQAIDAPKSSRLKSKINNSKNRLKKVYGISLQTGSPDNTNIGQINFCPFLLLRFNLVIINRITGGTYGANIIGTELV